MELKIEKEKVLKAAKKCAAGKEILEELFPDAFKKRRWDEIISYEIACEEQPVHRDDIIYETDSDDVVAYKMLKHIIIVVNDAPAFPNWEDSNQKKWTPIFNRASGFRFRASAYIYDGTRSCCGSRLCIIDQTRSDFMGKTHTKLYERFYH
ncbi:MAG: hypothetical protein NTZ33_14000 [Bacteroidetes bacterium]|nr:hypothetical protein [Bacteroidota bacterium]